MDGLSIQQAARILDISEQAVHKRIRSGTLKAVKLNGRWLVDAESAESSRVSPPRRGRPLVGDSYILMNGPYEVMEFSYRGESEVFVPGKVLDPERAPLGTVSRGGRGKADGLLQWWRHRSIPESRRGMDERLRKLGLTDPSQIPFRNLGLSLSDQYWICPAGSSISWGDVNYFDNAFGDAGGNWDGWLSDVGLSSPDNTSEGVLPKRWFCEGDKRFLLKGHVSWTDQQVYNEKVASLLHGRLLRKDEFVPYDVVQTQHLGVASVCPCFVEPHEEYVPFSLVLEAEGGHLNGTVYDKVVLAAAHLGVPRRTSEEFLAKMIVCDGILANTDRHLRNFGLIRDINDLSWRFAPLFDTGNCLWYDKDGGEVARGDYSFVARPFDNRPARQLAFASELGWLDYSALEGFAEEACEVLAEGDLSRWRLDYFHEGIRRRIAMVRDICG